MAFDGFPIYAGQSELDSSWALTDESLFAPSTWDAHEYVEGTGDLDQCNGLFDDAGFYAYYTTTGRGAVPHGERDARSSETRVPGMYRRVRRPGPKTNLRIPEIRPIKAG